MRTYTVKSGENLFFFKAQGEILKVTEQGSNLCVS